MNEQEVRMNAAIQELAAQNSALTNRAVALAADLAIAKAELEEMKKPKLEAVA